MLNRLWFRRTFAIGCYAIILLGSSVPGKQIPRFFELTPDKLIHCLEYMVLGTALLFWLSAEFPQYVSAKLFFIAFFIGITAAALDELYQNLTPGRSPDFYDWCLDVVGVLLAMPFYTYSMKILFKK